jgi:hypothetical protein
LHTDGVGCTLSASRKVKTEIPGTLSAKRKPAKVLLSSMSDAGAKSHGQKVVPSLNVIQGAAASDPEWWVRPVRKAALAVFVVVPFFAFFIPRFAGRVVWTVVIAALPLFIVLVGYHRWRRICPLAFVAQIPTMLKRPGRRKVPAWLEECYYYVPWSVFVVSLWLRLIATNGSGRAITAFFVAIAGVALACGFLFTGKTWCNFACPVSFIEKIYTEPHGLRETANSQCEKCTACKRSCPDINEENSYWKETGLASKRFAAFSFPGLVFGFYSYYYLQAGTWEYYFGGQWTYQPGMIRTAFLPGHDAETAGFFFLPVVPRAAASFVTLILCGLAAYCLFASLEAPVRRWLQRRDSQVDETRVRHVQFTAAAFTAFLTFYTFAGAPTLRRVPGLTHLFAVVVAVVATVSVVRRLPRTRGAFAEESLGRSIVKHWSWPDLQPPQNLHEAFLLHNIQQRESDKRYQQILGSFRGAVWETLADGFITREDLHLVELLRDRLQIKEADYLGMMDALAEEECARRSKRSGELTPENRLRLESYANALRRYLDGVLAASGKPNETFMAQLRSEYHVEKEEHAALLEQVFREIGQSETGLLLLKNWDA